MTKIKCEKCGKEINHIMLNAFNYDGADIEMEHCFTLADNRAVVIDTICDWCGYDLDEEERLKEISCPHCHQFPFKDNEIQVYSVLRVVCFRGDDL